MILVETKSRAEMYLDTDGISTSPIYDTTDTPDPTLVMVMQHSRCNEGSTSRN